MAHHITTRTDFTGTTREGVRVTVPGGETFQVQRLGITSPTWIYVETDLGDDIADLTVEVPNEALIELVG